MLYPQNNEELPLDALLSEWGKRNCLQPAEADAIRLAVVLTLPDLAPNLNYAWWASLFNAVLPNNAQMYSYLAQMRRLEGKRIAGSTTPFLR
ncbi:hypothetical protein LBMAG21_05210 [Armatimonadota bacterium]|nr:hypothetical protein LBMAG21_05210 [Armatimonadota bacterium]